MAEVVRFPVGTKVRIGSGHFGYVQTEGSGRLEIAFFGYNHTRGTGGIELLWIETRDVRKASENE